MSVSQWQPSFAMSGDTAGGASVMTQAEGSATPCRVCCRLPGLDRVTTVLGPFGGQATLKVKVVGGAGVGPSETTRLTRVSVPVGGTLSQARVLVTVTVPDPFAGI